MIGRTVQPGRCPPIATSHEEQVDGRLESSLWTGDRFSVGGANVRVFDNETDWQYRTRRAHSERALRELARKLDFGSAASRNGEGESHDPLLRGKLNANRYFRG